jgi:hypothetical protein
VLVCLCFYVCLCLVCLYVRVFMNECMGDRNINEGREKNKELERERGRGRERKSVRVFETEVFAR